MSIITLILVILIYKELRDKNKQYMITLIMIVGIVAGIGTWDMLKQIKRIKDVQYRPFGIHYGLYSMYRVYIGEVMDVL